MEKLAIDFTLIIDEQNTVISYEIIDKESFAAFDDLLSKQIDEAIDSFFPIDVDKKSGFIELAHMHFIYQVLASVGDTRMRQVVFSHRAMKSIVYARAMDKIEEGIHIYNSQGYGMFINSASEKLSGIKKTEFEGSHLLDLYNLDEDYSTALTTLTTQKPVLNRCDVFSTTDNKPLTTINSAFPILIDEDLFGTILLENDVKTLQKHDFKNRYLSEYMVTSSEDKKKNKYFHFNDIVHVSQKMKDLIHLSKKIALNESSILIYGETGTGKELLAQSIHQFSKKNEAPFIAVNCAAVPQNLAESLFFGTVKGAFTGSENSEGFFGQANGGTLFLDEINSMSLDMQSKLLRVLQTKTYRKIGSKQENPVKVRIIAAANEDLLALVEQKDMRSDFYYRISTLVLKVPSLAERSEDIELLIEHFINVFNERSRKQIIGVSKSMIEIFVRYGWPGNIRELENMMEFAFAMVSDEDRWLSEQHFPEYFTLSDSTYSIKNNEDNQEETTLLEQMNAYEKELIRKYLHENDGNISKTAKKLDIKRQSLQYRMKKYSLS